MKAIACTARARVPTARAPLRGLATVALTTALIGASMSIHARDLAVCADPDNLPFANQRGEGFENRIAELIAGDLGASVRYAWWPGQRRGFLRNTLRAGRCDVVMGISPGVPGVATTRPYYMSSYVLVSKRDRESPLTDLDDPSLRKLTIGLHAISAESANPPPAMALARRGLAANVVGYPMFSTTGDASPQARMIDAVATGEIDAAIAWGPFAGYHARRHVDRLAIVPIVSDPQTPSVPFTYGVAIGVRAGDEELRSELQAVLDRRSGDINGILDAYGVPRVAMDEAKQSQ